MSHRPSNREVLNKIKDALDALREGKLMIGTTKHLAGDLENLPVESESALPTLLMDLLNEIDAANPIACYAGAKPPQRSYEPEIRGLELWAYCWPSKLCGKRMYLKFALHKGWYVYVDCHEDRLERAW